MKRALILLVLWIILPRGGFIVNTPIAQTPALPTSEGPILHSADLPPTIDPADCGVPIEGPFGKDVEAFRGGDQGLGYELTPTWGDQETIAASSPQGPVTAAVINTEQIVALWKNLEGRLQYATWSGSWQPAQQLPADPASLIGNPAILASQSGSWEAYVSSLTGKIYWWQPTDTAWQTTGFETVNDAASEPAVVATDPQHTLLFYWDQQGNLRFTERQGDIGTTGGIWREKPLILRPQQTIYLPLIRKAPAAGSAYAEAPAAPLSSALSAASPDSDHAAVFFVNPQNQLWVIQWGLKNKADWSDARWSKLMEHVKIEKPAVASRHANHLAVAIRDLNGVAYLIEWTGATGWQAPFSLGKSDFDAPLTLAPTFVENLSVFGVDQSGGIWQKTWQADSSWTAWAALGTSVHPANNTLAAVVNHPDDMMLVYDSANNIVTSRHFTRLYQPPTESVLVNAGVTSGEPHGQALVWVDQKTLWITAEGAGENWEVNAVDMSGGASSPHGLAFLPAPHRYQASTNPYMAASDIDQDGDEEAVIATWYMGPPDTYVVTLVFSLLDFAVNAGEVTISILATQTVYSYSSSVWNYDAGLSTSLAFGDLNGDGSANELVLTYAQPEDVSYQGIFFKVYHYDTTTKALTLPIDATLPSDVKSYSDYNFYSATVQVSVGNLYPGMDSKQQIVLSQITNYVDPNCPAYGNWCLYSFPTLATYYLVSTDGSWNQGTWKLMTYNGKLVVSADSELADPDYWWKMLAINNGNGVNTTWTWAIPQYSFHFSSAMDTGDLDADGLDEIAYSYVDRVVVIDPTAAPTERLQFQRFDADMPIISQPLVKYTGLMRTLATGDVDEDGKAEILIEGFFYNNFLDFLSAYTPQLSVFGLMGDRKLLATNQYPLPTPGQGGRLNAVLMGDLDGDSFASRLQYCIKNIPDYRIIAVLNGAPRWYDSARGKPINASYGYYTTLDGKSSNAAWGTTYTRGASLTVGFRQEIDIPVVGEKIGEISASTRTEVMQTNGLNESSEVYNSSSQTLFFENGPGIVIYQMTSNDCYFYEIFKPGFEQDASKAITCTPGPLDNQKYLKDLGDWHQLARVPSWADVGHHAPDGSLSNDLGIRNNYLPALPVDSYLLLYEALPIPVEPSLSSTGGDWTWTQGNKTARIYSYQRQLSVTSSAGVEFFGLSIETSLTAGLGSDHSETMSWGKELTFYGRVWNFDPSYNQQCYTVVPYVYEAQAQTLAGVVYPYWEMDYYVPDIGQCH